MVQRHIRSAALFVAALGLAVGLTTTGGVLAQDTSSTPTGMMATPGMTEMAHPAHIHSGSCDTLGEVVYPLTDVSSAGMMGTPMAGSMDSTPMGDASMTSSPMASPMAGMGNMIAESTTTVQASLQTINDGAHAVNVHESAENIQNYIACGDITGTPSNNTLSIQLNELNGSGYQGTADLTDNGDGTTTVVVKLMYVDMMATPMASPMASPAS